MNKFEFSTTVFLPQRRSPTIVRRKLGNDGVVTISNCFMRGVGIATYIRCNLRGREIVEKHLGQSLEWNTIGEQFEDVLD